MSLDCECCTAERCEGCVDGSERKGYGIDLARGPDVTAITRNGVTEYITNPNWSEEGGK